MKNGLPDRGHKWPLTLVSAALGIGVVTALMAFANIADESARQRELELVQGGLNGLLESTPAALRPLPFGMKPSAILTCPSIRNGRTQTLASTSKV